MSDGLTELEHVIHLNIISFTGQHFSGPARTISIVVAVLQIRSVLDLFLSWQGEELFSYSELTIDFFLRQSESSNVEETNIMYGIL